MFPISLPCLSNTIRGQAGQCDWHFLYVQMCSPNPHTTSVDLFLGSSSWLISPLPFQLNASCPYILSALDCTGMFLITLPIMKLISHFTFPSFYLLHFYFWSSSSLQCMTMVWTSSHPPSSHSIFLIPCFLKHSIFLKGTGKLLSAIINHFSSCLLCYFSHLLPQHL